MMTPGDSRIENRGAGWYRVHRWSLAAQLLLLSAIDLAVAIYLRTPQVNQATLSALAWLMAVAFLVWAGWLFDSERRTEWRPLHLQWDRYDTLALATACIVAIPLRFGDLGSAPLTIHNDEASYVLKALALKGQSYADFAYLDTSPHTNLWHYISLAFMQLWGESIVGMRRAMATWGVISLAPAYLLARLLFRRRIAFFMLALLTTFHLHIHFSRVALNNITDPFWGALIFACLIAGVRTRRLFLLLFAGLCIGLSIYFYNGARLFVPLVGVMILLWLLKQHAPWKRPSIWSGVAWIALGALWASAPYLQNVLTDPTNFVMRLERDGVTLAWLQQTALERNSPALAVAFEQVQRSFLSFVLYPDRDAGAFYDQERPLLWGLAAVLAVGGLGVSLWRHREWRHQLLLMWFALAVFFGGMMMRNPPSVQRFVTLTPVFCLWMALALDGMMRGVEQFWPKGKVPIHVGAILLTVVAAVSSVTGYFWGYLPREGFGTLHSQRMTMLVDYLDAEDPNSAIWFVGRSVRNYGGSSIPHFSFDAPVEDRPIRVILDDQSYARDPYDWLSVLPSPETGRANVYVAAPDDLAMLTQISRLIPAGRFTEIRWPKDDRLLLRIYHVPPPAPPLDRARLP